MDKVRSRPFSGPLTAPAVFCAVAVLVPTGVLACNGHVADESSAPAPDGGQDGGAGGDALVCSDSTATITEACVPSAARAGVGLRLHVADAAGCYSSCDGSTNDASCVVTVTDTTIAVQISTRSCGSSSSGQTCTSNCAKLGTTCEIPPLAAGTYRVIGRLAPSSTGTPVDRELVVTDDASTSECLDTFGPLVEPK